MMSQTEFAAWLCCLDDSEAFEIWQAARRRGNTGGIASLSLRWRYRHV